MYCVIGLVELPDVDHLPAHCRDVDRVTVMHVAGDVWLCAGKGRIITVEQLGWQYCTLPTVTWRRVVQVNALAYPVSTCVYTDCVQTVRRSVIDTGDALRGPRRERRSGWDVRR